MHANPAPRSAALATAFSCAFLLAVACPRAEAGTYIVTFDDDIGDYSTGRADVPGNSGDLRYCLIQANANPGSLIYFNGVNATYRLNEGLPPITAAMTISEQYGGVTTIDAQSNGRIFFVDTAGATVNFTRLRLVNSRARGGPSIFNAGAGGGGGAGLGGAVFVNDGNVKFYACQFENSSAVGGNGGRGGAVQTEGGSGGGGLAGSGNYFAGGGGGFRGNGGVGNISGGGQVFGGGGGGLSSPGGQGINYGGGGGALTAGGSGISGPGVGGAGGGGTGGNSGSNPAAGGNGSTNGGGGGAGLGAAPVTGGNGGKYGGGGGGGTGNGGHGGEFGGGGGGKSAGGNGGFGGGGGGGGSSKGGDGGFGGGAGSCAASGTLGTPGDFGGAARASDTGNGNGAGPGGGGAALGGAVFVKGGTVEFIDSAVPVGSSLTAGLGGVQAGGGTVPASPGSTAGLDFFLYGGVTCFTLTSDRTINTSIAGIISGNNGATLQKAGPGTLTLTAANAYKGLTQIFAGRILLSGAGTLGSSNAALYVEDGAVFDLGGTNQTVGYLEVHGGDGGIITNSSATLSTFTLNTGGFANGPFTGNLALTKTGPDTFVLQRSNTYTGPTVINGGTLMLQDGTLYGSGGMSGSTVTVNAGGTFAFARTDTFGNSSALPETSIISNGGLITNTGNFFNTLRNVTLNSGAELRAIGGLGTTYQAFQLRGTLSAGGNAASSITAPSGSNNAIHLDGTGGTTFAVANVTGNAAADLVVSASLLNGFNAVNAQQPSTLTKTGAGTLQLQKENFHTGGTTVNAGTIQTSLPATTGNGALGSGPVTVNAGGSIVTDGDNSLAGLTSVGGPGNPIRINAGGTVTAGGSTSCHLPLVILDGGTLSATTANPNFANWNFDRGLQTAGTGATSTISGGNAVFTQTGGTVIDVRTNDTLVISTLLDVIFGNTGLIKNGPGLLRLSNNANAYTGGTTINAGTLAITQSGALGPSGPIAFGGGMLRFEGVAPDLSARLSAPLGQSMRIDTNGLSPTFASVISGAGGLEKIGPGTLTLSGANNFQGGVTLTGGTIDLAHNTGLGSAGLIAFRGGTLRFVGVTPDLSARFESVPAGQTIRLDTNGQNVLLATGMNGAGAFQKSGAGTLTLGGANSWAGGVGVAGGSVLLTGANTWSGGTTVDNGATLQVGNGGTAGSFTGNVLNNGTLSFRRSANLVYTGVISGNGRVDHNGTGALSLQGASTSTGLLAAMGGGVVLDPTGTWIGPFRIESGGRIALNGGSSLGGVAFSSDILAGGQLDGQGTVRGLITNAGRFVTTQTLVVTGTIVNAAGGVLRASSGGVLNLSGLSSLVNNGTLDLITGSILLPANFTNNGIILDASVVRVKTMSRAGSVTTVTIDSYSGHSYQLQKSTSLSSASFANVGAAQPGTTGVTLSFQDTDGSAEVFYRLKCD